MYFSRETSMNNARLHVLVAEDDAARAGARFTRGLRPDGIRNHAPEMEAGNPPRKLSINQPLTK
jgi:hypothetical protein